MKKPSKNRYGKKLIFGSISIEILTSLRVPNLPSVRKVNCRKTNKRKKKRRKETMKERKHSLRIPTRRSGSQAGPGRIFRCRFGASKNRLKSSLGVARAAQLVPGIRKGWAPRRGGAPDTPNFKDIRGKKDQGLQRGSEHAEGRWPGEFRIRPVSQMINKSIDSISRRKGTQNKGIPRNYEMVSCGLRLGGIVLAVGLCVS